jgi:hypothetical protein
VHARVKDRIRIKVDALAIRQRRSADRVAEGLHPVIANVIRAQADGLARRQGLKDTREGRAFSGHRTRNIFYRLIKSMKWLSERHAAELEDKSELDVVQQAQNPLVAVQGVEEGDGVEPFAYWSHRATERTYLDRTNIIVEVVRTVCSFINKNGTPLFKFGKTDSFVEEVPDEPIDVGEMTVVEVKISPSTQIVQKR